MSTENIRIKAIQEHANEHGLALALPKMYGTGTTGYNDCMLSCQSAILDGDANYLVSLTTKQGESTMEPKLYTQEKIDGNVKKLMNVPIFSWIRWILGDEYYDK